MKAYILRRLGQTAIVLFAVLALMWVLFRLIPGDPTTMYVSGRLTPEEIASLRKLWGLDAPLYLQFIRYCFNLLKGNLGMSFSYREPVVTLTLPRLLNTLVLMAPAMIMGMIVGTLLGSYLGWRRGTKREKVGITLSFLLRSFPVYLIGILAIMIFSYHLGWFPLGGMRTIGFFPSSWIEKALGFGHHLVLPVAVALLYFMGDVVVIARTSILELIGEEFLEFAKARGLPDSKVRRMAMRNAIIPVVTYSTIMVGFALGGQVLLEVVFSWPGVGALLVESVTKHDYPVAQAGFFIMAVGVIGSNLIVDLLYGYLDPRITYDQDH
jgi:peptide/nickel transport system permease protein